MKIIRSLLLLIIIILAILFFARDNIIKSAVSKYGSQSLQTLVEVTDVKSDIGKKTVELNTIEIANAKGFTAKNILEIAHFKIAIGTGTDSKNIVIDELSMNGIIANLEQNNAGVNIKLLADKLDAHTTQSDTNNNHTGKDNEDDSDEEININIKSIVINQSKIIANTQLLKDEITLPDLTLTNINATTKNIGSVLTKILLDEVKDAIERKGVDIVKGKLEKTFTRKIGEKMGLESETLDELKHDIKDKTEELKDKLDDQIKDKLKDNFKNIFKF